MVISADGLLPHEKRSGLARLIPEPPGQFRIVDESGKPLSLRLAYVANFTPNEGHGLSFISLSTVSQQMQRGPTVSQPSRLSDYERVRGERPIN